MQSMTPSRCLVGPPASECPLAANFVEKLDVTPWRTILTMLAATYIEEYSSVLEAYDVSSPLRQSWHDAGDYRSR